MKNLHLTGKWLAILLAMIILISVTAPIVRAAEVNADLSPYKLEWDEQFSEPILNEQWSWVREDPSLWSLSDNPGFLRITSSGSLFSNDQENILLTPAPEGNFRLTTRVITTPIENYHGANLYAYQDDDNYVEVSRIYVDGSMVGIRSELAGERWSFYVPVTSDDVLLRLVKEGDVYYAWYSEDNGTTWNYIEQFNAAFSNLQVGLGVRMGPGTTPLVADFDWIRMERIVYNSNWSDGFNTGVLEEHWSWVRENPELWSLSANPGHMRIISSGSLYQDANDQENVLLAEAPRGDYRLTSRVLVSPTENFHGATLYVYQDDDNYIELACVYNNDGVYVGLRKEEAGVTNTIYVPTTSNNIRFRITKEGNTYFGWFTEDTLGIWNYVGQQTLEMTGERIGISAKMGPTLTPVTTDWVFVAVEYYMEKMFIPMLSKQ